MRMPIGLMPQVSPRFLVSNKVKNVRVDVPRCMDHPSSPHSLGQSARGSYTGHDSRSQLDGDQYRIHGCT